MKIVIPGGSGQVGRLIAKTWGSERDVVILSRGSGPVPGARRVSWDGHSLGAWTTELEDADVVLNLAGRTVNCRYTKSNLQEMYDSRIQSARVVGEAIGLAKSPPALWLQMSTATIYAHTLKQEQDERDGVLGGSEPEVPRYWDFSVKIAKDWEKELAAAHTPQTRKVALRSAMVMQPGAGGIYETLARLAKSGLGGPVGGGSQYMSWIHGADFLRALDWIIQREELSGCWNLCAPSPLTQRAFMKHLRESLGVHVGLPATAWMAEIGAFFMRTDTELVLKSRRVVPGRLLESGFKFRFSDWPSAAENLATAAG